MSASSSASSSVPRKTAAALPPVEPSARVAAILAAAEGAAAASSPPRLPAAMRATAAASSLAHSSASAVVDPATYTAPGGRLRIGADGVPLKFTLAKSTSRQGPLPLTLPLPAPAAASTAVLVAAALRAAQPAARQLQQQQLHVDAVLSHQLALLAALVGPREAAQLDLADLYARRAQPTLLAEAARTLLSPSEDIEARHGLSFLQLDESKSLALHMFDDAALETVPELRPSAPAGRGPASLVGSRALAPLFVGGAWTWTPCTIRAVDPDPLAAAFLVEFDAGAEGGGRGAAAAPRTKAVHRLDLFIEYVAAPAAAPAPAAPLAVPEPEAVAVPAVEEASGAQAEAEADVSAPEAEAALAAAAGPDAEAKEGEAKAEEDTAAVAAADADIAAAAAAAAMATSLQADADLDAEDAAAPSRDEGCASAASAPAPLAAAGPVPPSAEEQALADARRQADKVQFGRRIAQAMRRREDTKAAIRLQYLVDSVRLPQEAAPLQNATLASVFVRAVAFRASWSVRQAKVLIAAARQMELDRDRGDEGQGQGRGGRAAAPPALDAAAEEAAALRDEAVLALRAKAERHRKLKAASEKRGFDKPGNTAALPLPADDDGEDVDDEDEDAIRAMVLRLAARRPRINPATNLPEGASAEQLLGAAAADAAVGQLFGEVVFEYDFAVKAAVIYELVKRAEGNVASAQRLLQAAIAGGGEPAATVAAAAADSRPLALASTAALRASDELEAFSRALAASFQRMRLPPPVARAQARAFGKVPAGYALPDGYALARAPVAAAVHTRLAKAIHVFAQVVGAGQSAFGEASFIADPFAPPALAPGGAGSMCFKGVAFPCAVKDYVRAQQQHVVQMSETLALKWLRDVANAIVDGLPGPPHFNVYEQDPRLYEGSHVQRALRRVHAVMGQQLRALVVRSCAKVTEVASRFVLDPRHDSAGDVGFTRSYRAPLFDVQLVLKKAPGSGSAALMSASRLRGEGDEEKKGEAEERSSSKAQSLQGAAFADALVVTLSPSPAEIARALTGSLQATASSVRMLKGIERRVMGLLSHSAEPQPLLDLGVGSPVAADVDACLADTQHALQSTLAASLLASPLALVAKFQTCAWVAEAEAAAVVKSALAGAAKCYADSVDAEEAVFVAVTAAFDLAAKLAKEKAESGGGSAASDAAVAAAKKDDKTAAGAPAAAAPPVRAPRLDLVSTPLDFDFLFAQIDRYHNAARYIRDAALAHEDVGLLRVRVGATRDALAEKAEAVRDALMRAVLDASKAEADGMHGLYLDMIERVGDRPKNEAQLLAIKALIKESEGTARMLEEHTGVVHARCERMGLTSGFATPDAEFKLFWQLRERPAQLSWAIRESLDALDNDKARMIATLEQQKLAFERDCENLEVKVNNFKDVQYNEEDLLRIVQRANDIDSELRAAFEKAGDFNERERSFGFPATQYSVLRTIEEAFEDFYKLWLALAEFIGKKESWTSTTILDLDAEGIERDVTEWWTMSYKLIKTLGDAYPGAAMAAKQLRALTDDFKRNVPLIRCLASKALEWRHWHQISQRIGKKINPHEEDVTLTELLAGGILAKFEEVEEVAVMAEKEHGLKKTLDAMTKEWDSVSFDCGAYKESGTFVVRGTDEINQMLDDQIVKTQTMMGSPYIKPNIEQCTKWEKLLVTVQLVLEEWLMMQRTWMYLEPIFSSEDIMRQMPQEGRRFATVDKLFRKTMGETHDEPKVLVAAGKDKMLDRTREANKLLDQIQKGLNDYLELKRLAFPRFFFLSNDELLEILSQTKDPRAAQPHLGKCFEGLAKIAFRGDTTGNADDVLITHMISAEGESIPLMATVDPNSPKAKGNVEVWFLELQRVMRLTVKDVVQKSLVAYPQSARGRWCCVWPGQVVLNVSQLYWTREVEDALGLDGNAGLKTYLAQLNAQLFEIVNLVRGKLSKMERTTLGALTVIDVHARDVIQEMEAAGVEKATDFNWSSQLRYYWEDKPDTGYDRYGDNPMNLVAKIINAAQCYGYEYLGNSSRLVITPLTDRCYRTLVSAVYLGYGGAPAGPAGTGKTETTKDLAKAMAIQCVVFNCSDGLDYMAMAKMFKGLAAAGAWACFDEFNRIELEVLSVVAQQVLTIQKAKRAKVQKFNFEGTILPLNPDANAFITMNPGYAGRSELPDNLKVLFRPVAMMVPDYALISEIKLYSFGFGDARLMARKLTQVLRLSSEQLSSQKHYDYGMRAVFSILVRAGGLRQLLGNNPAWSEDKIVLSAVQDVNVPKFTSTDLPLFKGIISDLFTGVVLPKPDYRVLNRAILGTCRTSNLQPKDEFLKSIVQLYETVQVRHGLMLVGETGCGKTMVLRTLQGAMSSIQGDPDFCKVHVHSMNPKSITQGQLYGNFDDNTHEWTDGVLAVTYRNASRDTNPERHWIMFDGPVDAVWIENMNTVLDDNKKLCLNSGEIIKMSPFMTMMFETDSLAEASPATVSRVGMVYMEPKRLGWRPVVQSWLATLPRCITTVPQLVDLLSGLFEWLMPPLLAFVANFTKQLTPVTDLMLAGACVRMLDSLFEKPFGRRRTTRGIDVLGVSASDKADEKEEKEEQARNADAPKPPDHAKVIEGLFHMACIWTVGGVVDSKGRGAFSEYFRLLLAGKAAEDARFKDFKLKAPLYDAVFVGGGAAARAGEGDVRDRDYDLFLPPPPEVAVAAESAEGKEEAKEGKDDDKGAAAGGGMQEEDSLSRFRLEPLRSGDVRVAQAPVPDDDTVFDYVFRVEAGKGGWKTWASGMPAYRVPDGATYQSIIVPTVDSARAAWLLDLFITHGQHVLCVGETGTGKSVTLLQKLMSGLDREVYLPFFLNFSAQTSANQTQEIIDGKMGRRRKGVFGPPLGQKFVILVEDLNMPAKEKYGAQPPIEILRQWMDHGGWYDRNDKDQAFMELTDVQFLGAMGPPGGGRTRISERYVRHFNVLGFVPFSNESLQKMFGTILQWATSAFASAVKQVAPAVVQATVDIYNQISREMLPTPAKSHYTFNLRDLSKVFQGMNAASDKKITESNQYIRLWAHESFRIFCDRLTTEQDRKWFVAAIADRVKEVFKKDWTKDIRGAHDNLIYGNFVDQKTSAYEELANRTALDAAMATALDDFNATSKAPLKLVLFGYAVEHVARISRILNQPGGNALLVGVGGSGRKSLTTLATFMAGYKLFQVEITKAYGMTEWRDDLKKVLMQAGREGKATVFLFSDTQIVKETFVEDINNVLNNGEVPNLFAPDERAGIIGDVQVAAKKEGRSLANNTESYAYFIDRVKAKLHVVLCFSPIGDAFRTRLRMFPSLVNCTTIDWFTPWPEEGLRSVATHFLSGISLPGHDEVKEGVIDVCCDMQQRVTALSGRFLTELRRYYYVTPTSYLELINTFKGLIGRKKTEILTAKSRYENGLEKIVSTEAMVDGMKTDLIALQPQLVVASAETDAMIARIEIVSKEANAKAIIVAGEEATCNEQAAAANAIKTECETQLAEAIPILEAALKAVGNLSKGDITEVKALKKPPDGVRLTVETLCIMFGIAPKKVPNPAGKGPKVDDYWEVGVKEVLGNSKLLEDLKGYDSDNIPMEIIKKIEPYIARPDFAEDVIARGSVAAGGLCKWVHAVVKYDKVAKIVAPKKAALAQATGELNAAMAMLAGKQAELKELKDKLAALESELAGAIAKKNTLLNEVETCKSRLMRANQLVSGLGGEKVRWTASAANLQVLFDNIVGDVVLSAGMIAYLGAFTSGYRDECIAEWNKLLTAKRIPCAAAFKLNACLGDPVAIRNWVINKLPNDSFSVDNAIMMNNSGRWPLCIDPQRQANKWIRNSEAARGVKVVKQSQNTFVRTIEAAIQFGNPVLLENVPEALDPVLEPLLARQLVKVGGVMTIRIGDNTVEYDPNFKLYITTVLPNPHYPPETCVKVNLLNFMATAEGLQDQMLGIVVKTERPELEEQREKLVLEDAENKRMLKELEDKILFLLANSTGNILDDGVLIQTLADSKVTSNQIMKAVEIAERTVAKIATARLGYVPVARRASMLFFSIAELASVDPMYQYSLEFYIRLFLLAIDKAPKPEPPASNTSAALAAMLDKRIAALKDTFTAVLYEQICRSLFEKDKLLFSFLLAAKVMSGDGKLDLAEVRFFLQGSLSMALRRPNPVTAAGGTWLSDKQWADLLDLAKQPAPVFKDLELRIEKDLKGWEAAAASADPLADIKQLVNGGPAGDLLPFQALMVLRCVRPDRVVPALQQFIAAELGAQFIDPPTFNLQKCFEDSDNVSPLIFVLVSGADPMSELLKLGEKTGKTKSIITVSLGQGQGPIAERAIADAVESGKWVCLQNCHLAESWLPTLERLVEEIRPEGTHPEFRLWLTAMPNPKFPVSVLQNGVKMTFEPPKGMRANLQGSFLSFDAEWFEGSQRSATFRQLVFGVCFFHAQCLERKKFGALGWNIRYDYSESDLRISLDQLKIFIDDPAYPSDKPPFAALTYLTGDCNYGGRVTDDNDRRSLIAILSDIYRGETVFEDRHKLSPSGVYYVPSGTSSLGEYVDYIRSLPFSEGPEVFGLNDNANISTAINETNGLLGTALALQPRAAAAAAAPGGEKAKTPDEVLAELAADIAKKVPDPFDIEYVEVKFPVAFEESMNTVLTQECMRYNHLVGVVKRSLREVGLAIRGLSVMSADLEAVGIAMAQGRAPDMWKNVAYPSVKPLGGWVADLVDRLNFLQDWIDNGKPKSFWISGFFFTQSFMTGTRQNFARRHGIPIDELSYAFRVLTTPECDNIRQAGRAAEPPADGAYIFGLFFQSASWDAKTGVIAEAAPRELFSPLPYVHLLPCKADAIDKAAHVYQCPVYKTSERAGLLSTSGHSTNYIVSMTLPMSKADSGAYWTKRSAALFTTLDT